MYASQFLQLKPHKHTFDQSNSVEEWLNCMFDSLDGNLLNSWAPPQMFKLTCANPNWLATSPTHLAIRVCKLFHVSNYIYATNFLKTSECSKLKPHGWCEHKGHIYKNIKKYQFLPI